MKEDRELFLISLIEFYEEIVFKQAKLNRQLIGCLKQQKESIAVTIDSKELANCLNSVDQKSAFRTKHQESDL